MSAFKNILQKHQDEIDRMIGVQEHGIPVSYSMMQSMGMLKPFAVRLPIPLLALLDEMMNHGLWRSKQEMVYDMIQSAATDFLESASEETRKNCSEIQQKSLAPLNAKNSGKTLNFPTGRSESKPSKRRVKVRRDKK